MRTDYIRKQLLHMVFMCIVITLCVGGVVFIFDIVLNGRTGNFICEKFGVSVFELIQEYRFFVGGFFYVVILMSYVLYRFRYVMKESMNIAREAEERKNELVVFLAHDLKTPLTSVIGYMSMLEECPDLPPEQRAKYTGIAIDKAYRLEQLINEFFDITRYNLQSVELEDNHIDLSMMLNQLLDEFYPVFQEKNLVVDAQIEDKILMLADADKLARVFDNLFRNATIYSPENGHIEVQCSMANNVVTVAISNEGDAIPPEKLERIFDKFFRMDSSRGTKRAGAGLGLAIAKNIVELHKGTLTAKSDNERTTFTVKLPLKVS